MSPTEGRFPVSALGQLPGEELPEDQPHEGARDEELPTESHGQIGRDGLYPFRGKLTIDAFEQERRDETHHRTHAADGRNRHGEARGDRATRAQVDEPGRKFPGQRSPCQFLNKEYDDGKEEELFGRNDKQEVGQPSIPQGSVVDFHPIHHGNGHHGTENEFLQSGLRQDIPLA